MARYKARHPLRSPSCAAGSQTQASDLKDLILSGVAVQKEAPALSPELLFGDGQLDGGGFPDSVYLLAAAIYQNNHQEKFASHRLVNYGKQEGFTFPVVKGGAMKRTAYELAFNSLKYQKLLEEIILDNCFTLPQLLPDDQMSLVVVMLYDFQDRKFSPRKYRGQDFVEEVRHVENCLTRYKTKLAASLARCRIIHDLLTINQILPESMRKKEERASSLPLYAWVNMLKSSLEEVHAALKTAGLVRVSSIGRLRGRTYCPDHRCFDTLVFPAPLRATLHRTALLRENKLIIQERSCSLGPHVVSHLLSGDGSVLMAGSFSGLTISHAASLIAGEQKAGGQDRPKIYAFVGDRTPAQREEIKETVADMGCKNVELIARVFQSEDGLASQFHKVQIILLSPQCSMSAISNPLDFMLQESRDESLLQGLSQGSIDHSKLQALIAQQKKDVDHALKFPKVRQVVYTTCSLCPEENEDVLRRSLEQAWLESNPSPRDFRLSPLPPSCLAVSKSSEGERVGGDGPFFRLEPTEECNGCFLAILIRVSELDVSPHEVLNKAKGLLERIDPSRRRRTNRKAKAAHPHGREKAPFLHSPKIVASASAAASPLPKPLAAAVPKRLVRSEPTVIFPPPVVPRQRSVMRTAVLSLPTIQFPSFDLLPSPGSRQPGPFTRLLKSPNQRR